MQAHLGTGRAIRAALAPYGTLVLRSSSRTVGADAASVSIYVNALGADGASAGGASAQPLSLSVSLATWLGAGASVPVASLCRVTQAAARSANLAASPAATCTSGGADAAGWNRLTVSLDGYASAGWDALLLTDVSGRGGTVFVDDVALWHDADADAAQRAWGANTQYCLDRLDSILYGCTVPPSVECCADYAAFNTQGCYCIPAVLDAGGADMQRACLFDPCLLGLSAPLPTTLS
jgi:hypothetical protein